MDGLGVWVHIVKCADGSYDVGSTRTQRGPGEDGYTWSRRPVTLVYCEDFPTWTDGFARERQLKGWSRAKKEALIAQRWDELQRLSRAAQARGSAGTSGGDVTLDDGSA